MQYKRILKAVSKTHYYIMEQKFWERLSRYGFIKTVLANPAPRWMVLIADTFIVLLSCILTCTFNTTSAPGVSSVFPITAIVATYFCISLIFKSYWYIIRLSVIEDMYRLALHVSVASIILVSASLIIEAISGTRYLGIWNLIIIAVFSFAVMMCMRLLMKYFYTLITGAGNARKPVIMLGSTINSFVFASALKNETEGQFDPVALLNISNNRYDTTLNGIPILKYEQENVKAIFDKYGCDTLLFLSTQIEQIRSGLADVFLENHIKLLMLNQIEEFGDNTDKLEPNLSTHVRNIKIEDLLGRATIQTDNPHISQHIYNQVVLITGAAGSIGGEIVRQVAMLGAKEIVLVDQAETPMHELQLDMEESFPNTKIDLIIGDITNWERMERVFRKFRPKYVFHAAAYKHVPMMEHNPSEAILTNVFGSKNLADLSVKYNVDKFVMISTDKAVNPTNIMGASKRIAEIYVQSLFFNLIKSGNGHTKFITTRFGNVLGSSGSVIPRFSKQIEDGGPVTVTHREIIRYFMTIPEACSLVLEAGCMGNGGEIYIFDMGRPIKIYDLACRMISLAGLKVGEDIKIVETGLRPGEKLYEELLNDKEKTIATHHKKIMIAQVQTYEYSDILESFDQLYQLAKSGEVHNLVTTMKLIVPEFHSQNSEWENIDKEINEVSK